MTETWAAQVEREMRIAKFQRLTGTRLERWRRGWRVGLLTPEDEQWLRAEAAQPGAIDSRWVRELLDLYDELRLRATSEVDHLSGVERRARKVIDGPLAFEDAEECARYILGEDQP